MIDLTLTEVVKHLDGNFIHTFQPALGSSIDHVSFEVGQYVIISTSERLAITTGILTCYKEECIEVSLERYVFYPSKIMPFQIYKALCICPLKKRWKEIKS